MTLDFSNKLKKNNNFYSKTLINEYLELFNLQLNSNSFNFNLFGESPYTLLVEVNIKTALGQYNLVNWSKFTVANAFILKSKLTAYLNDSGALYDYVLIDCPPSLSLLTVMALVASNSLLVPFQSEFFALEGVTQLMKTIERIKVNLNPSLEIQGILLTMYDKRNKLSSEVEQEARSYFKEKVYQTVIQRNVRLSEAPSHGLPCVIYDKNCVGSKSYFKLAEEFMKNGHIESAAWAPEKKRV